jgi:hypothetical protein
MKICECGAEATETITLMSGGGREFYTCAPCKDESDAQLAAHSRKRRDERYRSATRAIASHVAMQRRV